MFFVVFLRREFPEFVPELARDEPLLEESRRSTVPIGKRMDMYKNEMNERSIVKHL